MYFLYFSEFSISFLCHFQNQSFEVLYLKEGIFYFLFRNFWDFGFLMENFFSFGFPVFSILIKSFSIVSFSIKYKFISEVKSEFFHFINDSFEFSFFVIFIKNDFYIIIIFLFNNYNI